MNDNIYNFDNTKFMNLFNVNVLLIIETLNFLLKNNKINNGSKLVIISSIWEKITRSNKLSYTLTKSSLGGLVKSLSYDLSEKNILINNILPGVIFNDMTLKNLSIEQMEKFKNNISVKWGDYLFLSNWERQELLKKNIEVIEADLIWLDSFYKHSQEKLVWTLKQIIK